MFFNGTGGNSLKATFPKVPLEIKPGRYPDRDMVIAQEADHIAKTAGERSFPWRVFVISDDDKDLITNTLNYQLSRPLAIENTAWIKPGKVAWDWWNAWNVYGVDFEAGINTETYKYYIDFASEFGMEYVILDEGWSNTTDLFEIIPEIDLGEIIRYGKEKNVGIILWTLWKPLDDNLQEVFNHYAQMGVLGFKVDFMQRADQLMVNYYERVAREAAKRELIIDFHGAYKPAGLHRAYPNVLTYEGVKGLENSKWGDLITPGHDVTIPFIRMLAGPMDYTPGAMVNAQEHNFEPFFTRPMSQGTRCHQAAMYVVYESPLQMLCDNPSNYLKEPIYTDFISKVPVTWDENFISKVPVTWDETIVLEASVGEYIIIARRKGKAWYIGGMTNWEEREFEIKLDFLEKNNYNIANSQYKIEYLEDGINANRYASDYVKKTEEVSRDSVLEIRMAKGGGFLGVIRD
jgi:alpha-glucosidase